MENVRVFRSDSRVRGRMSLIPSRLTGGFHTVEQMEYQSSEPHEIKDNQDIIKMGGKASFVSHVHRSLQVPSLPCSISLHLFPHLQSGVHTDDTPHEIPISTITNPIADHDTDPTIALHVPLRLMLHAKKVHNGRIQLRSNLLRPAAHLPEVTRAQKVQVQRTRRHRINRIRRDAGHRTDLRARTLEVIAAEVDFLLNVHRLEHLAEVLHAHAAVGIARRVVRPVLRVQAPAAVLPLVREGLRERETAHQHDLPARLAQMRDPGLGEPARRVACCVVLAQDRAQLLVGGVAGAFALYAHDEGF